MSEQLQISPVDSYPKISRHFQIVPIFSPNMSKQWEIWDKVNCCLLFTLVQTFEEHPGRFQVSAILPRLCQTFLNCLNDCQTCQTLVRLVQTSVTVSDLCPAVQTLSAFPDLVILSIFVSNCSELLWPPASPFRLFSILADSIDVSIALSDFLNFDICGYVSNAQYFSIVSLYVSGFVKLYRHLFRLSIHVWDFVRRFNLFKLLSDIVMLQTFPDITKHAQDIYKHYHTVSHMSRHLTHFQTFEDISKHAQTFSYTLMHSITFSNMFEHCNHTYYTSQSFPIMFTYPPTFPDALGNGQCASSFLISNISRHIYTFSNMSCISIHS